MKKRIFVVGVACAMALACFSACGKGGDDGDGGEIIPPETPITEKVTIKFWGWGDTAEQENYQTLVNQFMAEEGNENINVVYRGLSSQTFMTTLKSSSRNLPELFFMPDYDFLEWASSGLLKDISGYVTNDELSALWPQALDEYYYNPSTKRLGQSDGAKLYGLPKDLGPFTLVYNKTLLNEKLGNSISIGGTTYTKDQVYETFLNPEKPMTWTQLRNLLKAVDTSSTDSLYGISHYELEAAVYSNNANFFNDDASTQKITDPRFVEALQFIADLDLVDHVMTPAALQAEVDGFTRFLNGGCIFSFMGPWDSAQFWKFNVPFETEILPVAYNGDNPDAKSTAWVGSMAYSVSKKASALQTQAAMRLAKYLCMNEGAQRKFYELGQQVPNIVTMAKGEYLTDSQNVLNGKDPQDRSVWVNTIDNTGSDDVICGKVRARYYTYTSGWYTNFTTYLDEEGLWTGSKTASQICANYSKTFQDALDGMRANLS